MQGTIIKGIAGFYYVEAEGTIYECKARGKFRNNNIIPTIGDNVIISIKEEENSTDRYPEGTIEEILERKNRLIRPAVANVDQAMTIGDNVIISIKEEENSTDRYPEGTIEEILERKNRLIRPAVANVDQAMIVFSVSYPQIHLDLLDKFLIHIEQEKIEPYILLNKIDDDKASDYQYIVDRYTKVGYKVICLSAKEHINTEKEKIEPYILLNKIDDDKASDYQYIVDRYTKVGYKVICLSAKEHINTEIIMPLLKDKTTVFAGPSGVGKSTLINTVQENFAMETGSVSDKIKRGKHTTRHVELMPLKMGGFIVDTPGFTSLNVDVALEDLEHYFPEFRPYLGECRYRGCAHINETAKDCRIKLALEEGDIIPERYEREHYFPEFRPYLGECRYRGCAHINETAKDCRIKLALEEGDIIPERYESYKSFYNAIKEKEARKYK